MTTNNRSTLISSTHWGRSDAVLKLAGEPSATYSIVATTREGTHLDHASVARSRGLYGLPPFSSLPRHLKGMAQRTQILRSLSELPRPHNGPDAKGANHSNRSADSSSTDPWSSIRAMPNRYCFLLFCIAVDEALCIDVNSLPVREIDPPSCQYAVAPAFHVKRVVVECLCHLDRTLRPKG